MLSICMCMDEHIHTSMHTHTHTRNKTIKHTTNKTIKSLQVGALTVDF